MEYWRKKRVNWAVLALLVLGLSLLSGNVQAGIQTRPQEPPVVVPHDETGRVSFIGAGSGAPIQMPSSLGRSYRQEDAAAYFLDAYGPMFGLQDPVAELDLMKQNLSPSQNVFRYQQVYQGVPIMAGEIIVNTTASGDLRSMSGEISPDLDIDVNPTVALEEASQTALGAVAKAQGINERTLKVSKPKLWIYDEQLLRTSTRPAELVWRMEVSSTTGLPINELVLVNAHTGGVSLHFNQIDTFWYELGQQQDEAPEPTTEPTVEPTPEPTTEPTAAPTDEPEPTTEPTAVPTEELLPTSAPTQEPALETPTEAPQIPPELAISEPDITGTIYYVSTTGDDANDCVTTSTPCATIQAAVDKTVDGDGVYVAEGTYTGLGDQVIFIERDVTISGGWNANFTAQTGYSTVNGEDSRSALKLMKNADSITQPELTIERFIILRGRIYVKLGKLYLSNALLKNMDTTVFYFNGTEESVLDKVVITENYRESNEIIDFDDDNNVLIKNSGIYNNEGTAIYIRGIDNNLKVENTTISGNRSSDFGAGIIVYSSGFLKVTVDLNNVTITKNIGRSTGGLYVSSAKVYLQNSLITDNYNDGGISRSDCTQSSSQFFSGGYNIISNLNNCVITPGPGDMFGVDVKLLPLGDYGGPTYTHPVPANSIAVDGGNPALPGSGEPACLDTDQRGLTRPTDGDGDNVSVCDIGAFEYQGEGTVAALILDNNASPYFEMGKTAAQRVYVLDEFGSGVPGVSITFTAPAAGPSGIFTSTGTRTVTAVTNSAGLASSGGFIPNMIMGDYEINVTSNAGIADLLLSKTNIPPIRTYSMNNSANEAILPGQFICNYLNPSCTFGSDLHADFAHQHALGTMMYYHDMFNRNSFDNAGSEVISSVHFGSDYSNAFWNGEQLVYGDYRNYPIADDVVAHELTHAVTQHESNLFYYYQSGAISESLSDVFGEFFDLSNVDIFNGSYHDASFFRWEIGEVFSDIRNMQHPPAHFHPDKMTSPYYDLGDGDYYNNDNGGVHTNSGVNNKAVYLMTDGNIFNGYTINGIGVEKVAAIYYEVQTKLLTSGADYKDLYYAVQQACINLTGGSEGITPADCTEVTKALDAVEMNLDPVSNFNPDTAACPKYYYPLETLFHDGFESGTANWTIQYHDKVGANTWSRVTGAASEGIYSLLGINYQGYDAGENGIITYARMDTGVWVSVGTYMKFDHIFGFEDPNYDGGLIQYSANNGPWVDMNNLLAEGQGYTGKISNLYGNPYGGQWAFVGDSHGYVSSLYNLTPLAGKNVRFRWVTSSDEAYFDWGWIIDNVGVYRCQVGNYGSFVSTTPGGKILKPRDWLIVEPYAEAGTIDRIEFYAAYDDGSGYTWHYLGQDKNGINGWRFQWGNANVPDQTFALKAVMHNTAGYSIPVSIHNMSFTTTIDFGDGYNSRGGRSQELESLTAPELVEETNKTDQTVLPTRQVQPHPGIKAAPRYLLH